MYIPESLVIVLWIYLIVPLCALGLLLLLASSVAVIDAVVQVGTLLVWPLVHASDVYVLWRRLRSAWWLRRLVVLPAYLIRDRRKD